MEQSFIAGSRTAGALLLSSSLLFSSGGTECLAAVAALDVAGAGRTPATPTLSAASTRFIADIRQALSSPAAEGMRPLASLLPVEQAASLTLFFASFQDSAEELTAARFLESAVLATPGSLESPEKFKDAFEFARIGAEAAFQAQAEQIRQDVLVGHANAESLERENARLGHLAARCHFYEGDFHAPLESVQKMAWAAHSERGMEVARAVARRLASNPPAGLNWREKTSVRWREGTAALHSLLQPASKVPSRPHGIAVPMIGSPKEVSAHIGDYRIVQNQDNLRVGVFRKETNGNESLLREYRPNISLNGQRITVARNGSLGIFGEDGNWQRLKARWRALPSFSDIVRSALKVCFVLPPRFITRILGRVLRVRSTANDIPMPAEIYDESLRLILKERSFARPFVGILAALPDFEWHMGQHAVVGFPKNGRLARGIKKVEIVQENGHALLRLDAASLDHGSLAARVQEAVEATRRSSGHPGFHIDVAAKAGGSLTRGTLPEGQTVRVKFPLSVLTLSDRETPKENLFFFRNLLKERSSAYDEQLARLPDLRWHTTNGPRGLILNGYRDASPGNPGISGVQLTIPDNAAYPDLTLYSVHRDRAAADRMQQRAEKIQKDMAALYASFRVRINRTGPTSLAMTLSGEFLPHLNPHFLSQLLDAYDHETIQRQFSQLLSHFPNLKWETHGTGENLLFQSAAQIPHDRQGSFRVRIFKPNARETTFALLFDGLTPELAAYRKALVEEFEKKIREEEDPGFSVRADGLDSQLAIEFSSLSKPESNERLLRLLYASAQHQKDVVTAKAGPKRSSFVFKGPSTLGEILQAYPQAGPYSKLLSRFPAFAWSDDEHGSIDGQGLPGKSPLSANRVILETTESGRLQIFIILPWHEGKKLDSLLRAGSSAQRTIAEEGNPEFKALLTPKDDKGGKRVELLLSEGFDPALNTRFFDLLTQAYGENHEN